jgi:hypothetical protein
LLTWFKKTSFFKTKIALLPWFVLRTNFGQREKENFIINAEDRSIENKSKVRNLVSNQVFLSYQPLPWRAGKGKIDNKGSSFGRSLSGVDN